MECKLCFTPFNNTVNDPRMLSCGHTVCLSCLVRLLADNKDGKLLKCPFDTTHKPSDLPETLNNSKVSTITPVFPPNHAIAHTLQTPEGLKPKCSRKECGPTTLATSFCVHCKKNLCPACTEYHSIFCPGHGHIPVNAYVPSQKCIEDRSNKDSARKASYEKSVKEAEDAKRKEDEEEDKKVAAEIEAIFSQKVNLEEIPHPIERQIKNENDHTSKSVNNNIPLNPEKERHLPPPAVAPRGPRAPLHPPSSSGAGAPASQTQKDKENIPERPIEQKISPKTSPQNPSISTPKNVPDDGPRPAMPRRPAATVRTAASTAGAGAHAASSPRGSATVRATPTQPRSGTESPLPEGWTEVVDKKSGKKYYYNKITKKTSWHKPAEGASTPGSTGTASPAAEEEEAAAASPLPEGWSEVVDKKSGRKYYYNKITKETSWRKPEN